MKRNTDFEYELVRSDRRTLSAEITPDGRLLVRAPERMRLSEIEKFLADKEYWIVTHLDRAKKRDTKFDRDRYTELEIEEMKRKTRETVLPLVEKYKHLVGVEPSSVKINRAKKRFGSCGPNNGINFSCYLALYPIEAVEYVVVHELCHILEHNHSARFYAQIERVMPDYRARCQLLRDAGYDAE